jgi:hypothetical protein
LLPFVNTQLFNRVLADFAKEFEWGPDKRVLLVVDFRWMASVSRARDS